VNSPLKSRNAVWDGKRVRLFGARNEVIAFQLIVEAGSSGIKQLSAALPELQELDEARRLDIVDVSPVGPDIRITARVR